MNTAFNLLRVPLQVNFKHLTSYSTVSNFTKLSSISFKGIGYDFLRPALKQFTGNSVLSQECHQQIVPYQIQNSITSRSYQVLARNGDDTLKSSLSSAYDKVSLSGVFSVRTNVRDHFGKPNEWKRLKKHGWRTRMRTKAGREIIMRRILKGRHCLTH